MRRTVENRRRRHCRLDTDASTVEARKEGVCFEEGATDLETVAEMSLSDSHSKMHRECDPVL